MSEAVREFSAKVSIDLIVGGHTVPVRQSGGDFIITSYLYALPPGIGTLVLSVDAVVRRFKVYLTEGIRPDREEQPIVLLSNGEVAI